MRRSFLYVIFLLSCIINLIGILNVYVVIKKDPVISCIATQSTNHGHFLMQGKFDFLFEKGKGSLKVNGITNHYGDIRVVSRQIFFDYFHHDTDFVLDSKQIQMLNNGDPNIANSEFNKHFPAFFSQEDKQLSMVIRQDIANNYIMYFGEVPVFYCMNKK